MIWWKRYRLHDNIHTLPLDRFIRCICKSDLSALVISGKPSQEKLVECWANLWFQYMDLNKDNDALYVLLLRRQISVLESEIKIVECIVVLLREMYVPALVAELRSLGITNHIPPFASDPGYSLALDGVLATVAPKKLRLDECMSELVSLEAKDEGDSIDETYFSRMLMRLSKFQGYQIRVSKITVGEFVQVVREYLQHINQKQKQFEK